MKVLYELPERERSTVNKVLDGEKLIYCTPYDLSINGELADGWLIITEKKYIVLECGKLLCNESILSGTDYKLVNNVGSGAIEGSFNGEEKVIVRFSMTHLPRYTMIARVLEDISKGEPPKVISDNNENNCPRCGRPYAEGTKVCHNCTNKKVIFRRFLALLKPYWFPLSLSLPIFWAITGLTLINPMLYRKLIDGYLMKQKADGFGILFIILGIGVCDLAKTLLDIIKNRLMTRAGSGISRDLRKTVFAKIHTLSIGYIDSKKTGDLMNRVNGDTGTIQNFISNNAAFGINQILNFIVLTLLLFIMNWRMALLVIAPVPFIAYTWIWLRRTFSTMYHSQWKVSDKCNSILQDILSGIRVVKAFAESWHQ
jgi:ATP-binding cassette subfamily B protein